MWIRQSTASQEILLGAFLDSTDGNTAETGLTIANTDIKLWKEGATTEANKNSGGATHIASGRYYAVLDATDSNTLGKLEINVHVSGALAVRREFMVVPANVYDSLILGTDDLDTAVVEWNGVALGTTNPLPNAAADAAGGLPISDAGGLALDTQLAATNEVTAARMGALTDWINGGRLDLILDIIAADVVNIDGAAMRGTDGANTTVPDAAGVAPTAAEIVDEWETQSQADPTGFHVNVLEVGGTAQTANDNGADINTILSRIIGTLASGTHNPATAAQIAVLSDWINGGRLDLILDIIAADVVNIDGAAMRGTDSANTTVPDAAGVAPTAVEIRQEMDSNSVQLNTTLPGLIDDLAIKKNATFSNFEFLMVLTSDHVTPATGLTVTGQRSINGGAFTSVSGSIAEVSNGIYQFDAVAADTNGDVITWRFLSATADDTFITFKTVA